MQINKFPGWPTALSVQLAVLIIASAGSTSVNAAPSHRISATTVIFPTFGVSLAIPQGWRHLYTEQIQDIGRWGAVNEKTGKLQYALAIQTIPKGGQTLFQNVQQLVQQSKGELAPEPRGLGGRPTFHLKENGHIPGLPQQVALISARGGYFYGVELHAAAGETADAMLEFIRAHWRWLPFVPPIQHLTFRRDRVPACGGRLTLLQPDIMRSADRPAPAHELFSITDYRTGDPSFIIDMQVLPQSTSLPLRQVCARFAKITQKKLRLHHPMVWLTVHGSTERYMSSPFRSSLVPTDSKHNIIYRYGLIRLPKGKTSVITFTLPDRAPTVNRVFETTMERVFASINPG